MEKQQKTQIMSEFAHHEKDTGSTEVQVAVLTTRIHQLTDHMADNRHDYHTKRGLLRLVGRRRRLLSYLRNEDADRYQKLIAKLGLRK
ncbi:MAG: 30S ribosomal protein S15 [Dehalococcoidales bacterium]